MLHFFTYYTTPIKTDIIRYYLLQNSIVMKQCNQKYKYIVA